MKKKNVDYGHRRHKCSICGKVRFEIFMASLNQKTRYGKECWKCVDNPDSEHSEFFRSY